MPAKAKPVAPLSGFVESDMDDELDTATPEARPTPDSNQENKPAPAKKGRGRTKAAGAKFTKTKAPARRVSGGAVAKKKGAPRKKAAAKREPLKEQTNIQHGSDTEEVDGFDAKQDEIADPIEDVSMDEAVVKRQPAAKRKPAVRGRKKAAPAKQEPEKELEQQSKATEKDGEFEYTPTVSRQSKLVAKPAAAAQKAPVGRPKAAKEIPETQAEPMEMEPSSLPVDEDAIPQSVYRQPSNFQTAPKIRQPSVLRRRAGSASDTERTSNDPTLRRKLGDLTKKFDNLELKYNNLREVGIEEAKTNFSNLKAQSEAKTKTANDLIASLRKDISHQKSLAQESRLLTQQISTKDSDIATLHEKNTLLTTSLQEAQNEIKALHAKLSNVRSASSAVESVQASKTPGSAIKGKATQRTVMMGSAEAAQAARVALLKEDLYSDLTGLIIRGVEKGPAPSDKSMICDKSMIAADETGNLIRIEADIYDCIQTGRNGSMSLPFSPSLAILSLPLSSLFPTTNEERWY